MTCVKILNGYVCVSPSYKLRLADGTRVFMEWHRYCGPEFYYDKSHNRIIDGWYENELFADAVSWFVGKGYKA